MSTSPSWAVSHSTFACCEVFGLWDRLGDAPVEQLVDGPCLESLGVASWRSQVLDYLIPVERPVMLHLSAATWKFSAISRTEDPGRSAWAQGVRWRHERSNSVVAAFPASDPTFAIPASHLAQARTEIFQSLGYDDERLPEFVFLPQGRFDAGNDAMLCRWCAARDMWCDPSLLIPERAAGVFALSDGWLHIAVELYSAPAVLAGIAALADRWGVRLTSRSAEYAWLC